MGAHAHRVSRRRQAVLDTLGEDDTVIFYEPATLDAAIVGVSYDQPGRPRCVVYDYDRLRAVFVREGMTVEDAEEWMDFNTLGAWLGEQTPVVIGRVRCG